MSFFTGTPGSWSQQSTLNKGQQGLHKNLIDASMGRGGGGAFGQAADYYRDLLSNDSQTYNQMQAPQMRQFNEQIIPDLSEQFAGMGSGGLSSSGFRNAAVGAGTDLSERLGAIRAQLRQQGAAGLMGLGQQGLNPVQQNVYTQGQPGLLDFLGPAIGSGLGMLAGPAGSAIGGGLGQIGNWFSRKGQSSPYGDTNPNEFNGW